MYKPLIKRSYLESFINDDVLVTNAKSLELHSFDDSPFLDCLMLNGGKIRVCTDDVSFYGIVEEIFGKSVAGATNSAISNEYESILALFVDEPRFLTTDTKDIKYQYTVKANYGNYQICIDLCESLVRSLSSQKYVGTKPYNTDNTIISDLTKSEVDLSISTDIKISGSKLRGISKGDTFYLDNGISLRTKNGILNGDVSLLLSDSPKLFVK